jgi:IPT/TIG domain
MEDEEISNIARTSGIAASMATVPVGPGGNTIENIGLSTPQIAALSPSSVPIGTVVSVTGSNFGALQGLSTVTFGTLGAAPTQWSNTAIVVPVPSGATTGSVTVTVGGTASNAVIFTVGAGTFGMVHHKGGPESICSLSECRRFCSGRSIKVQSRSPSAGELATTHSAPITCGLQNSIEFNNCWNLVRDQGV